MIDELTVQEQELAARTSYAYWVASTSANKTDFSTDETRIRMAMREARRHLVGAAGQRVQAMNSLLYTCDFRKVRPEIKSKGTLLYQTQLMSNTQTLSLLLSFTGVARG